MIKFIAPLALCLATALHVNAAPVDLGSAADFTPYDAYMRPVRQVLGKIDGKGVTMERVRELMRKGRDFRYSFVEPYVASLPHVTEARKAGDCKDKALWLASKIGDQNIRFVVGKARHVSNMSHAWLMWKNEGRWWILDCSHNHQPVAADQVAHGEYIPLYSWGKSGVYEHETVGWNETATVVARNDSTPVRGR